LQRATSGIDRVKPQRAGRRGQPSGAKAHHATIVGEAEIYRAGRATRDQSVYGVPAAGGPARGLRRTNAQSAVTSVSVPGPPASPALASAADGKADYVRPIGRSRV
jgi:hypothetical protein